ncbi:MAG: DUF350 domain-containing protein [Zoogloea sp.]|uniref:DUF350 domain-containing protein n=1 Tax=Zoogloea sp. TaxID=49181 RepID=UPI0026053A77|nr:DUF350 domain-containing protein [Zoogloea sp.]MDD2988846.1 DUF350 domain-containing protein [Zoogloea sp.]
MEPLYNYVVHLLSGLFMVLVFANIYLRVTPFCELSLIRQGIVAPALSLGGAVIGFSLTVASSILHNDSLQLFLVWSVAGLSVQLLAYVLLGRLVPRLPEQLAANNVAAGAFAGMVALVVGILNAACMS